MCLLCKTQNSILGCDGIAVYRGKMLTEVTSCVSLLKFWSSWDCFKACRLLAASCLTFCLLLRTSSFRFEILQDIKLKKNVEIRVKGCKSRARLGSWNFIFTTIGSNVAIWFANLPLSVRVQSTLNHYRYVTFACLTTDKRVKKKEVRLQFSHP